MATEKLEIVIEADDRTSGTLNTLQIAAGNLAANLLSTGVSAALEGLRMGLEGVANAVQYAIEQAMENEEVMAQLQAAIESTGGQAGVTADMADELATSLSRVTRYSDDAVLSAEATMLTFTNIGQEVFPQAIGAVLDMSTAMDQDLKSSVLQVGKALNDPIALLGSLTRVGVVFTEEQKEQIKTLQESGDLMGAQKIILGELAKEFGGSATAAGETFAGKMDIMKNSLDNVAESIGMAVLPTLNDLLGRLLKIVEDDKFQQWVDDTATKLGEDLPAAMEKMTDFWDNSLKPALDEWGPLFKNDILPALGSLAELLGKILPPALWLSSVMIRVFAASVDLALAPIRAIIDGVMTLKNELANLLGLGGGTVNVETAGAVSAAIGNRSFAGAGVTAGAGAGGGGGMTVVNVNAGTVLSFADEQSLEMAIGDLIRRWVR